MTTTFIFHECKINTRNYFFTYLSAFSEIYKYGVGIEKMVSISWLPLYAQSKKEIIIQFIRRTCDQSTSMQK